jgi:hypothetical protein
MKAAGIFLLTTCMLALAPRTGHSFELEGFAGYYRYDESLASRFEADSSPIFGLRFGSGAQQIISGETTFGFGPAKDMNIILIMGNFLINIPVDRVVPFVTLGTGTTIYLPEDITEPTLERILDTETKLSFNYGGGARYFLNDIVAARFDVRDYVTFDLDFNPSAAADGDPTEVVDVGTIHNMVVSGGLSIVF